MIPGQRQSEWLKELKAARERSGEDGGFPRFMAVAECARGGGLFEAKSLVSTISDTPEDNGEGEAILSLLAEFEPKVQVQAKVEELPRLEAGGEEEWSNVLIEELIRYRWDQLVQVVIKANPLVRSFFHIVASRILEKARLRGDSKLENLILEALQRSSLGPLPMV